MQVVESNERAVVLTVLAGDDLGAELLVTEDGERIGDAPEESPSRRRSSSVGGRSGVVQIAGRDVLRRCLWARPRLLIYGAVDTAQALCRAAQEIGWRPIVADAPRPLRDLGTAPEARGNGGRLAGRRPRPGAAGRRNRDRHPTDDDKFDVPMISGALEQTPSTSERSAHGETRSVGESVCSKPGVDEERSSGSGPSGLDVGAQTAAEHGDLDPGRDHGRPGRTRGRPSATRRRASTPKSDLDRRGFELLTGSARCRSST